MVSLARTMLNNFVRCAFWQQLLSLRNIFCSTGAGAGGDGQWSWGTGKVVGSTLGNPLMLLHLLLLLRFPFRRCLCLCTSYLVSCGRRYIIQNLHKINKLNMPDMRCAVGRLEQPELLAWPSALRETSDWSPKQLTYFVGQNSYYL